MYHGTDIEIGKSIIESQKMLPSTGDHHWLGNGVYFYLNAQYAFRWIAIKYTNNFKNIRDKDYKNIFNEYIILIADINSDRVFDLDDIDVRLLFIGIKDLLSEKSEESERIRAEKEKSGIVDGVVLNVLFEKMGYNALYDYVKASFPISYVPDSASRLDFLPEPQVCVKNIEIIKNIKIYNKKEDIPEYSKFVDLYRSTKSNILSPSKKKPKYSNRNSTKGSSYYKKGGGQNGFQRRITKN